MEKIVFKKETIYIFFGALFFLALFFSSLYSYVLFHSLAELFSIIIVFGVFIIGWNSRRMIDNHYFLFLVIAFFFVGVLDILHLLSYPGMCVFREFSPAMPNQFFLVHLYVLVFSFLLAVFFIRRRLNVGAALCAYIIATSLLIAGIFYWNTLSSGYAADPRIELFERISTYAIFLLYLAAAALLFRNRRVFAASVRQMLIYALLVGAASQVSYAISSESYGLFDLLGHFLQISVFYLIYRAILVTAFQNPYDILFRNLKNSEEELQAVIRASFDGFWIIDLQGNFLSVNDTYCKFIGYSRDELLKMRIQDVEAVEKPEETAARIKKIKETGSDLFETKHRRKDGTITDVEASVILLKGDNDRLCVFLRDITWRKKDEDNIKARSEELEKLNKFMIGRELKMAELKKEIENLKKELPERFSFPAPKNNSGSL